MAGNPAVRVIISSPLFIALSFNKGEVKVENASKFALEPEFTKSA